MAREIKYFNGSSGSGTLYTVPAGRTSKVTFNYIDTTAGAQLFVAGKLAFPSSGIYGGAIDAGDTATSVVSPGPNQGIALISSSRFIVNVIWYLGAGATVAITGFAEYNFMAIEEY